VTGTSPLLLFVAATLVTLGCSKTEEPPPTCERVRERLIQLQLPNGDSSHKDVMRRALGPEYIAHCTRSMSESQQRCVLDARDVKAALACTSQLTRAQ